jgi:hypothetical protein
MIHTPNGEDGQGMVEYLLIVSLVVLTIVSLFAKLMHSFPESSGQEYVVLWTEGIHREITVNG